MSDDLERQNSRLRAQEEDERAPYLNGGVHRPEVGTMASGSHALGARELPEGDTDLDVQGLLAVIGRQLRLETGGPRGFEPPSQP
jgi:hypothetical protein